MADAKDDQAKALQEIEAWYEHAPGGPAEYWFKTVYATTGPAEKFSWLNEGQMKSKQKLQDGSEIVFGPPKGTPVPVTKPIRTPRIKCLGCKRPLCPICKVCETRSCRYFNHGVSNEAQLQQYPHLQAKTQKIVGFGVLAAQCKVQVPSPWYVALDEAGVQKHGANAVKVITNGVYGPAKQVMARPAPTRPQHGFVESRPVSTVAEISMIFQEARKHDPEAELLLMPFLEAKYNAVITPTMMAFGPGHDGGTAGKESISFPLSGVPFAELRPGMLRSAGIDPAIEDPYIEVVLCGAGENQAFFTQLRAGAKLAGIRENSIPQDMTVTHVVKAEGDLLEWQARVKAGFEPGTVVSHVGGSLVSHYAVHCLLANVPIVTSHQPRVGERFAATDAIGTLDPEAIALGCGYGVMLPIKTVLSPLEAATMLLGIAHNALAMTGKSGIWLGIAATCMLRLGMAASHGERRHGREGISATRDTIYSAAFRDFWGTRQTLGHAAWDFHNLYWTTGFGGHKWYQCTMAALQLDKAIRQLLVDRTEHSAKELVGVLHNAINQAHNGGWWLNKFCQKQKFDDASNQSLHSLTRMIPSLARVHKYFHKFSETAVEPRKEALDIADKWMAYDNPPIVEEPAMVSRGDSDEPQDEEETDVEIDDDLIDDSDPGF